MKNSKITIGIIYSSDPTGRILGGVDSFIRGIIKWAPDEIEINLIGVTTDKIKRPVGKWTRCFIRDKGFNLYPVISIDRASGRSRIPSSLKFTIALFFKRPNKHYDVAEFHRIEPSLLYFFSKTPKNIFIHQSIEVLTNPRSSVRWKRMPYLFKMLEDVLMPRMDSIFIINEKAARHYRDRYSKLEKRIDFIPTWFDSEIFFPVLEENKQAVRKDLLEEYSIREDSLVLNFIGRLDHEKNPILLIKAFEIILKEYKNISLIIVGDGVLRKDLQSYINTNNLLGRVILAGLRSPEYIAKLHNSSDVCILTSAYEGMPISVLEALACGLPVVSTDVGEIRRIVIPGLNGEVVDEHDPEPLAKSIDQCLRSLDRYKGVPCVDSVTKYRPQVVLKKVYARYRELAKVMS